MGSSLVIALQTEEKKVRKKLQSGRYMALETRKDGTKFTNKALKEAAERLQSISKSYDQRQHALVEQVCDSCFQRAHGVVSVSIFQHRVSHCDMYMCRQCFLRM